MALKQQGMVDDQIIKELERQGYNSSQIFDALNQVNIQAPTSAGQPPGYNMPSPQQDLSYEQPPPQKPQPRETLDREQIEEIVEAIIDEKWKEFEEDVKKIIEWKDSTQTRINHLDQQIKDLATSLNSLHKNLLNKISDYDKNITDVGTEIKAMEKVFQKILPNLTENVNKLERMSKGSKSTKK